MGYQISDGNLRSRRGPDLRAALSRSWRLTCNVVAVLLLIAAEMIGANKGVGFQVMNAQYNFQIPLMFAAIFILAFLGLAAKWLLVILQRRLCRWSIAQH